MSVARTELKLLLKCLISMAVSDNQLHQKEIETIQQILRELVGYKISQEKIQEASDEILSTQGHHTHNLHSAIAANTSEQMKDLIVKATYLVMISDGKVVDNETERLADIAAQLGVDDDRFMRLVREVNATP